MGSDKKGQKELGSNRKSRNRDTRQQWGRREMAADRSYCRREQNRVLNERLR